MCRTDGRVRSHVVAVVKTDKGQEGHVRGKGQDEQDSHHAGRRGPPQTQRSDTDSLNGSNGSKQSDIIYVDHNIREDVCLYHGQGKL